MPKGKISLEIMDEQIDELEQEELAITWRLMVDECKQELARTQEECLREVEKDIAERKKEVEQIEAYSQLPDTDPRYIGIQLRSIIGVENLMWGSDNPHAELTFPKSREIVERILKGMPEEEKALIAGRNAAKLYRFN